MTPAPPLADDLPFFADLALARALDCTLADALRRVCLFAHHGLPEAQVTLGQYLIWRGGTANAANAAEWFRRGTTQDYAPAWNMLGRCYERSWGVPTDVAQAAECYARAAALGSEWGQYNLANALLRGRGLPRDRRAAYHWFRRAADAGHAKSMNLVGRFLEEGWTGERDFGAAMEWYLRAAEGGDYRGQFNLATCLDRAGQKAEAATWFLRSAYLATADLLPLIASSLAGDPVYATAACVARGRIGRMARADVCGSPARCGARTS